MTAHSKLCDDVTGTGENLDQVLYFGLQEQIREICRQRSEEFKEYGVTPEEVLHEMRCVIKESDEEILNTNIELTDSSKEEK
jgi:hypothetical protein